MASGLITSWKQMGKEWKQKHFILGGSKITVVGDCSHVIKRRLLLGRKNHHQLRQHIKKQRHYLANKGVHLFKAMIFQ